MFYIGLNCPPLVSSSFSHLWALKIFWGVLSEAFLRGAGINWGKKGNVEKKTFCLPALLTTAPTTAGEKSIHNRQHWWFFFFLPSISGLVVVEERSTENSPGNAMAQGWWGWWKGVVWTDGARKEDIRKHSTSGQANSCSCYITTSFLAVLFCLLMKLTHREDSSRKRYGIKLGSLEQEVTLEE